MNSFFSKGIAGESRYKEQRIHGDGLFPLGVYETKIHGDYRLPLYYHWHPEIEILFLTRGRAHFFIDGTEVSAEEGDVLLIQSNILHGCHNCCSQPLEFRAVVFDPSLMQGSGRDIIEQKYLEVLFHQKPHYGVIRGKDGKEGKLPALSAELYRLFREKKDGCELLIKSLLYQVFYDIYVSRAEHGILLEPDMRKNRILRDIVRYTQENSGDRIRLEDISSQVGLSPSYFCRFFRESFHMTYGEYLLGIRLQNVKFLLTGTDRTMEEIAAETGFSNGSHLSTAFRTRYGITPGNYRKQERNGEMSIFYRK